MGQCYSIMMKFKVKNETGLVNAIRAFISEYDPDWIESIYQEWGDEFNLDSIEDIMRLFFSELGSVDQIMWGTWDIAKEGLTVEDCDKAGIRCFPYEIRERDGESGRFRRMEVPLLWSDVNESGFRGFTSDFDASYGWEGMMDRAFAVMARFLEDGSLLVIYPDVGSRLLVVKGGNVKELSHERYAGIEFVDNAIKYITLRNRNIRRATALFLARGAGGTCGGGCSRRGMTACASNTTAARSTTSPSATGTSGKSGDEN